MERVVARAAAVGVGQSPVFAARAREKKPMPRALPRLNRNVPGLVTRTAKCAALLYRMIQFQPPNQSTKQHYLLSKEAQSPMRHFHPGRISQAQTSNQRPQPSTMKTNHHRTQPHQALHPLNPHHHPPANSSHDSPKTPHPTYPNSSPRQPQPQSQNSTPTPQPPQKTVSPAKAHTTS